jgi:hypothetical protein
MKKTFTTMSMHAHKLSLLCRLMKKQTLLLLVLVGFAASLNAQVSAVPQKFNYSTQVTDSLGAPIAGRFISMRATLHNGSGTGPAVYCEIDTATTSATGIFTVVIGGGAIMSGSFSGIPWANAAIYFQVEMDVNGGTNYVNMGNAQLISYPYALLAGNGPGNISFDDMGKAIINTADGLSVLKSDQSAWVTTGNAGVAAVNGFIGTTDATDLVLKRNGIEGLRLGANNATTATGNVGVRLATGAPLTAMDINGALTLRDTIVNVTGNFTLNIGNRSMITLYSNKTPTLAAGTLANGLVKGQLLLLLIAKNGAGAYGVKFVRSTTLRLNASSLSLTDGCTLSLVWSGTAWVQTGVSFNQ